MAIAPIKLQINKNTHEEKHMQYVQGVTKYIKNTKTCHVVTLTGEAIRPKGGLGAMTAKRQLLYISRHITLSPVVVLSHIPRTKLNCLDFNYYKREVIVSW